MVVSDVVLFEKYDINTTVQICTSSLDVSPENIARHAITMVYADSTHNNVIICIGTSLQICQPPTASPKLLANSQYHNRFKDGFRAEARLSTVHGIVVDSKKVVIFNDYMNNCVREIGVCGHGRTICGYMPTSQLVQGKCGFVDGYADQA